MVAYGDNIAEADAGFHFDDLLLHTGNLLWPDADEDGDVDQDDFGSFQSCYSGADLPITGAGCNRFDRDNDGDVDTQDYVEFEACSAGPSMLLAPDNLPPGCEL
jgi:hypothetical protein